MLGMGGAKSGGLQELKSRLLFLLFGLVIYRLGCYIPVPGINPAKLALFFGSHSNGILGMFNMFSGGALQRVTIFALGIMPYISASIIVQMYSAISPEMKELKKEGEAGQRKINKYTRYGTLGLSFIQAIGISKFLVGSGLVFDASYSFYFTAIITLVTGTMFLMWLGEQITERGIGNGISMIIFASIVSRLPEGAHSLGQQVKQGQLSMLSLFVIVAFIVAIAMVVVFFERAQRRININYAKRQQGRRLYAAQTSHLPLKINMSGVIPPIFASALIMFPGTIARFFATSKGFGWLNTVALFLSPGSPVYIAVMAFLVIFFCFFYTALVFNSKETADNLKKSGAYIPGIRPGEQTAKYIESVMDRLTLVGSLYLTIVALLPEFILIFWQVPISFGGTSLLISVVVIMDFMAQVQAHLMSHQYESIMDKSKSGKKGKKKIGLID